MCWYVSVLIFVFLNNWWFYCNIFANTKFFSIMMDCATLLKICVLFVSVKWKQINFTQCKLFVAIQVSEWQNVTKQFFQRIDKMIFDFFLNVTRPWNLINLNLSIKIIGCYDLSLISCKCYYIYLYHVCLKNRVKNSIKLVFWFYVVDFFFASSFPSGSCQKHNYPRHRQTRIIPKIINRT